MSPRKPRKYQRIADRLFLVAVTVVVVVVYAAAVAVAAYLSRRNSYICYISSVSAGGEDETGGEEGSAASIGEGMSSWVSWTPCSATCGRGTKRRHRHCGSSGSYNGTLCEDGSGVDRETADCNLGTCGKDARQNIFLFLSIVTTLFQSVSGLRGRLGLRSAHSVSRREPGDARGRRSPIPDPLVLDEVQQFLVLPTYSGLRLSRRQRVQLHLRLPPALLLRRFLPGWGGGS